MALTVFLVEDSKTIRDNLIPALEDLAKVCVRGFSETEIEAVRWLQTHTDAWDVAVVDLFLKQGSGLGVLRACRTRSPHQKMVVLSNYATEQIRSQAAQLGAEAVFDKSTELESLFDFLDRLGK